MRLELAGLTKDYSKLRVLHPLDLTVEDGEFLTILGPSGSGKTTVLKLIGGFIRPSGGRILFDGADIAHLPTFKRPLNTVFQDYALFPHMSVAANVGYGLMVRGRPKDEIRQKVAETLETVGLGAMLDRYPDQLSGGQKQRVALARAIICQPKLILLDEPLGALDAEMRKQMQLFLKHLQRRIRTTFLFVTHDQEEAITMSDRIAVMNQGRLEQVGTPKEIYYQPRSTFVAGFFGDNNLIDGRVTAANGSGVTVETPLGTLDLAAQAAPGSAVKLTIRPESLAVGTPAAGAIATKAVVEEAIFVGATTQLILHPIAAPTLRLTVKSTSDRRLPELAPEAEVDLHWQADDMSLVVAS